MKPIRFSKSSCERRIMVSSPSRRTSTLSSAGSRARDDDDPVDTTKLRGTTDGLEIRASFEEDGTSTEMLAIERFWPQEGLSSSITPGSTTAGSVLLADLWECGTPPLHFCLSVVQRWQRSEFVLRSPAENGGPKQSTSFTSQRLHY